MTPFEADPDCLADGHDEAADRRFEPDRKDGRTREKNGNEMLLKAGQEIPEQLGSPLSVPSGSWMVIVDTDLGCLVNSDSQDEAVDRKHETDSKDGAAGEDEKDRRDKMPLESGPEQFEVAEFEADEEDAGPTLESELMLADPLISFNAAGCISPAEDKPMSPKSTVSFGGPIGVAHGGELSCSRLPVNLRRSLQNDGRSGEPAIDSTFCRHTEVDTLELILVADIVASPLCEGLQAEVNPGNHVTGYDCVNADFDIPFIDNKTSTLALPKQPLELQIVRPAFMFTIVR